MEWNSDDNTCVRWNFRYFPTFSDDELHPMYTEFVSECGQTLFYNRQGGRYVTKKKKSGHFGIPDDRLHSLIFLQQNWNYCKPSFDDYWLLSQVL